MQGGQQRLAHVALAVSRRAAGPRIAHPKQRCFSSSRDEGGHRVRSGETMCAHVTPRRASKGSSGAQFRQQRAPACAAVATAAAQVPVVTFAGLELFQRDFVAAAVSALGAIAVVKAFDILVSTGMMDRVRLRGAMSRRVSPNKMGLQGLATRGDESLYAHIAADSRSPYLSAAEADKKRDPYPLRARFCCDMVPLLVRKLATSLRAAMLRMRDVI